MTMSGMPDIGSFVAEQNPDVALQNYTGRYGLPPGLANLLQTLLPRIQRNYTSRLSQINDPSQWPTFQDWLAGPSKQDYMQGFQGAFGRQRNQAGYNPLYDVDNSGGIDIQDYSQANRSNANPMATSPWDYINQLVPSVLQGAYRGGQATRQGVI